MELVKDENVILDNGYWGPNKKLVLTNLRLLVQKRKKTIKSKWKIENEILLEEIEEAYEMIDVFTSLSSLVLKLKNKDQLLFNFRLIDSQMPNLGEGSANYLSMKTKEITDKFSKAINQQISKKHRNILSGDYY